MIRLLIFTLVFLLFSTVSYSQKWSNCEISLQSDSTLKGFCIEPKMKDKIVKFKTLQTDKEIKKVNSAKIHSIKVNDLTLLERVQTLKRNGNKKQENTKFWLKSLRKGYASLYVGEVNANGITTTIWYMLKQNDTAAFYITMKYSGGMAMTVGANKEFRKNVIKCLYDYPELINRIENKEFNLDQISEVIGIYNTWKESQK
jgi:hypothetical protein